MVFNCFFCGIESDRFTFIPDGKGDVKAVENWKIQSDPEYGAGQKYMITFGQINEDTEIKGYYYFIECPVCLNKTRFWRKDHFPIDRIDLFDPPPQELRKPEPVTSK
jgi:hypothetical protein